MISLVPLPQVRDPMLDVTDPPLGPDGKPLCPDWPTHPSVLERLVAAAAAAKPFDGDPDDGGFPQSRLERVLELLSLHMDENFPDATPTFEL